MAVPEQDPERYLPLTQLMLEQVLHAYALVVPEHDPERYLPLPQLALAQVLHTYALVVPLQVPERYFPAAQLMLEQVEHPVLVGRGHPLLLYLPAVHALPVVVADFR